jgi:hypothetical protein
MAGVEAPECVVLPRVHGFSPGVRFLPDARSVALRYSGQIQVWDSMECVQLRTLVLPERRITEWCVVPTAPESYLLGAERRGLFLLDRNGETLRYFEPPPAARAFLGAEAPGLGDPTPKQNGQATKSDAPTGCTPYDTPCSVAVSRNGTVAAVAYGQNFALVWDLASGQLRAALGHDDLDSPAGRIYRVDISPDGRHVLARRADGVIHVWDWRTRRVVGTVCLPPETGPWRTPEYERPPAALGSGGVGPAAFVGQGVWIAAAVAERILAIDWITGEVVARWRGHEPWHPILGVHPGIPRILQIHVSADGRRALTVGVDASLCLWSVASGRLVWSATPDVCCLDWGDLSADGRSVAWTACPGTRVYRLPARL